ncbi:unnamed protein product [Tuber melanosporum]|uniref:(Perigord truffle) hypothetical protein n=1 Tax=Tuber melanosporum (strain Mel28) TaxID=656061 RepID=D5G859_TUBMM|nr:uncharacterized protein GSTUM_00002843001 [Tuber melanosporum]CAZ80702.1 unnamed protein product [Tuber melanosporum]
MDYFKAPNPGQSAYFSPLAPNDPHEGRAPGYSRYSHDYPHDTPTRPSPAGHPESHEMMFSPGGYSPDGLQTKYSFLPRGHQQMLGRNYSASSQKWKLLAKVTARFIVSFAACAGLIAAFKVYEDKKVLSRIEKRVFNAIYVGISLILSMNIISSFKAMASVMRWKILAAGTFRLREVDLVLDLSSFQSVWELMRISVGRPARSLACFAWILLGVAVQIGVALLGLSYNMENDGVVQLTNGLVNITDMRSIFPAFHMDTSVEPDYGVQQSTAHLYGDMATFFPYAVPGSPEYEDYTLLELLGEESTEWRYYFRETYYTEKPGAAGLPTTKTNRSVTVTPYCEYYPIVEGQFAGVNDTNVTISIGNRNVTIDWMEDWGTAATTYVNPGGFVSDTEGCGPRCSRVYIFQWVDEKWDPPSETGSFFNCTINISQVENANPLQPFHSMPDLTAEMAAGAIGLEGFVDDSERQFVRYTSAASWWGQRMKSTDIAAVLVGKFAVGVIAAYDFYGPKIEAMGLQSRPGISLSVNWLYVSLTLGSILFAQFVCGIFVVYSANSVFCKDDSYLSTARLLRPLVERLGNSGSTSTGFEISQTFTRSVRYGVRSDLSTGQPIHHLDVGEDIMRVPRFPEGHYN